MSSGPTSWSFPTKLSNFPALKWNITPKSSLEGQQNPQDSEVGKRVELANRNACTDEIIGRVRQWIPPCCLDSSKYTHKGAMENNFLTRFPPPAPHQYAFHDRSGAFLNGVGYGWQGRWELLRIGFRQLLWRGGRKVWCDAAPLFVVSSLQLTANGVKWGTGQHTVQWLNIAHCIHRDIMRKEGDQEQQELCL